MDTVPESILWNICCYIHFEELDKLRWVNKRFFALLSSTEFIMARKANGVAEEILIVADGEYPVPMKRKKKKSSRKTLEETPMGVIYGYIPSLQKWKRFGSDDLRTRNIRRYSTVFIPHLYILLFLGGYHDYSCAQSNQEVWAFSFLTNCCQQWPAMLISQKRKHATSCPSSKIHVTLIGERYIVAIASDQQNHQNQKFDLKLWKWTQISNPPNHYHDDHRNQKDIAAVVASPCCRYLFLLYESNPTYPYDYYSSSSLSSSQSVAGYSYHVDTDVWSALPPTEEESNIVVGMNTSTIVYHDKILLIGGIIPCSYNSNNDDDDDDEYYNEDYTHLDSVSVLDLKVNESHQNDDTTCTSPSTMLSIPNLPIPVRGASSCIYDGTLTVLGGLSSFSSEIYTNQSSTVWQLHCDANEVAKWKSHPSIRLPHAALLNGLCFSIVL